MLSFNKLLLLALVVVLVFYGIRLLTRLERARAAPQAPSPRRRTRGPAPAEATLDLVKCSTCGAYVSGREPHDCAPHKV